MVQGWPQGLKKAICSPDPREQGPEAEQKGSPTCWSKGNVEAVNENELSKWCFAIKSLSMDLSEKKSSC